MDDGRGLRPAQALVGIAGLAIALWGLAGSPEFTDTTILRWAAVGVAVILGVALIVAGGVSRRKP
ncbi:hypothetical protein ASG12_15475 [Williamsia sp. Leaf354]|uniref:hypothetical protein n=1 Tax=Williamsia sp. Leaf354 TaxID=1736349 RepID=UPI0006FD8C9F|nr:hypothetical protein [Williamsia sp. Leaf354]KQR97340.1 hypothetical protein ASG12_15475 [Williamsia sp. Leaf354]